MKHNAQAQPAGPGLSERPVALIVRGTHAVSTRSLLGLILSVPCRHSGRAYRLIPRTDIVDVGADV